MLVPIYKEAPDEMDRQMLEHCLQVFCERPIVLVHPQGMNLARYTEIIGEREIRLQAFASANFISRHAYNDMLMEPWFYRAFMGYEYILVHQLDSWVFADTLDDFLSLGLDYIGCAPAREGAKQDGGLSLRRTVACMEACKAAQSWDGISLLLRVKYLNLRDLVMIVRRKLAMPIGKKRPYRGEDSFFSFAAPILKTNFRVGTPEQALRFGYCENPAWLYRAHKKLPMGCHAPFRNGNADFWHLHIGIK